MEDDSNKEQEAMSKPFTQAELNNLVCDLDLLNKTTILLGLSFNPENLFAPGIKSTWMTILPIAMMLKAL